MRIFSSEVVASSSQRQTQLEVILSSISSSQVQTGKQIKDMSSQISNLATHQELVDAQLSYVVVKQEEMVSDLKSILELLKKP